MCDGISRAKGEGGGPRKRVVLAYLLIVKLQIAGCIVFLRPGEDLYKEMKIGENPKLSLFTAGAYLIFGVASVTLELYHNWYPYDFGFDSFDPNSEN